MLAAPRTNAMSLLTLRMAPKKLRTRPLNNAWILLTLSVTKRCCKCTPRRAHQKELRTLLANKCLEFTTLRVAERCSKCHTELILPGHTMSYHDTPSASKELKTLPAKSTSLVTLRMAKRCSKCYTELKMRILFLSYSKCNAGFN